MMEERILMYVCASLLVIILLKLKMKSWWKYLNLGVFTVYFSLSLNELLTHSSPDGGWVVHLLTSFLIVLHLGMVLLVFFVHKKIKSDA
jgi:hypothetical protein